MTIKYIAVLSRMVVLSLLFLLSACAAETVGVLYGVKSGMSVDEVRKLAGKESEITTSGDREYYLFRLFESQAAKYFSNRSHYIVVVRDGNVIEWGPYQSYFPDNSIGN